MDETREVNLSHASGFTMTMTVIKEAFDDAVMRDAVVMPAREWEFSGIGIGDALKPRQVVTLTIPHWEFQVRARVASVKGDVVRLREVAH